MWHTIAGYLAVGFLSFGLGGLMAELIHPHCDCESNGGSDYEDFDIETFRVKRNEHGNFLGPFSDAEVAEFCNSRNGIVHLGTTFATDD